MFKLAKTTRMDAIKEIKMLIDYLWTICHKAVKVRGLSIIQYILSIVHFFFSILKEKIILNFCLEKEKFSLAI